MIFEFFYIFAFTIRYIYIYYFTLLAFMSDHYFLKSKKDIMLVLLRFKFKVSTIDFIPYL